MWWGKRFQVLDTKGGDPGGWRARAASLQSERTDRPGRHGYTWSCRFAAFEMDVPQASKQMSLGSPKDPKCGRSCPYVRQEGSLEERQGQRAMEAPSEGYDYKPP